MEHYVKGDIEILFGNAMIKNGKCVNINNSKNITTDDDALMAFPTTSSTHRTKIPTECLGGKIRSSMQWYLAQSGELRLNRTPKPKKPLKEWKGLRDQGLFDFSSCS